jgi:N-acetylmuramoyl-L-alanine amidase
MRSCVDVLTAAVLVCTIAASAFAQSAGGGDLYKEALAREALLRKELDAYRGTEAPVDLLGRIRVLVGAYQDLDRLFPDSSYSDDALWQGGMLAADVFARFGDALDRTRAVRMLNGLVVRFPGSAFSARVPEQVSRLDKTTVRAAAPPARPPAPVPVASVPRLPLPDPIAIAQPRASAPPPVATASLPPPRQMPPAPSTPSTVGRPSTSGVVALRSIRHEVLPEALRITIDLDREVQFYEERIAGPDRVFIDLQNTRAVESLRDTTIAMSGQVVKQIRVGTQVGSRTRVVFDLTGNSPYSIYTLYDPYRVVIDFERRGAPAVTMRPPAPMPAAASAVVPPASSAPAPGRTGPVLAAVPSPVASIAPLPPPPAPPSTNAGGGFSLSRQLGLGISRIVIDPGHGGNDSGATVTGLTESGLVLDVALRLEKLLQKQRDVEVVLTRRTNAYVPLEERTAIANRSEADLFLSIHANANASRSVRGVETYFLNFAANPEAEAIAARENAGSSRSMRELPDIVQAIALNNKLDESRDFAAIVQSTLYERLRKVNRTLRNLGVKQAPFMVLIGAEMPAILAEISFMTNSQEATLLKTEKYRQQIAEALLAGVMQYQEALKKAPAVATTQ